MFCHIWETRNLFQITKTFWHKKYNKLDADLRQSDSLSTFKSNLLTIHLPKRKIFNIHDPKGVKRLFQLQVGLSPLRFNKLTHKFADNPSKIFGNFVLQFHSKKNDKSTFNGPENGKSLFQGICWGASLRRWS